jgi:glycosyltransferase involved in cell wall biosynthesis
MNHPTVTLSIIVASYNRATTLRRCIDSVLNQELASFELSVIDGASSDGSVEILKGYTGRVHWSSEADRGLVHAWNKGIDRSTGEWLYFLGADDYLLHTRVFSAVAAQLLKVASNELVAIAPVNIVARTGRVIRTLGDSWRRESFVGGGMNISHQGVFHNRSLFREYGLFDESFRIAADYELLLRYLRRHDPVVMQIDPIAAQEVGGLSASDSNSIRTVMEFARVWRKLGIRGGNVTYYWLWATAIVKWTIIFLMGKAAGQKLADRLRSVIGKPALWRD